MFVSFNTFSQRFVSKSNAVFVVFFPRRGRRDKCRSGMMRLGGVGVQGFAKVQSGDKRGGGLGGGGWFKLWLPICRVLSARAERVSFTGSSLQCLLRWSFELIHSVIIQTYTTIHRTKKITVTLFFKWLDLIVTAVAKVLHVPLQQRLRYRHNVIYIYEPKK